MFTEHSSKKMSEALVRFSENRPTDQSDKGITKTQFLVVKRGRQEPLRTYRLR
jgi:hypothetical protein